MAKALSRKFHKYLEKARNPFGKKTVEFEKPFEETVRERTEGIFVKRILLTTDELTVGYMELEQDIFFHKIPKDEHIKLVKDAIEFGRETAYKVIEEFKTKDPTAIAKKLGVAVKLSPTEKFLGKTIVYSEYFPKSRKITIYEGSLSLKALLIPLHGLESNLRKEDLLVTHLSHELFHAIAERRRPFRKKYQVTTFKFGPIRINAGIRALDEIAANSFAKNLANTDYSPRLLDYFLTKEPSQYMAKIKRLSRELKSNHRKKGRRRIRFKE